MYKSVPAAFAARAEVQNGTVVLIWYCYYVSVEDDGYQDSGEMSPTEQGPDHIPPLERLHGYSISENIFNSTVDEARVGTDRESRKALYNAGVRWGSRGASTRANSNHFPKLNQRDGDRYSGPAAADGDPLMQRGSCS
ncbi:hypothetical protein J6590_056204 [Homalodisca vitripennis]|nr:hypothetical protein J6590_056204 [Homalodisca vitripennis]